MSGIRYLNIDHLPQGISEEHRQMITGLARSAPKPTYILMIHPFQWCVSKSALQALNDLQRIPEDVLTELRLLDGQIFRERPKFLLAVEGRIGQKARAKYEDDILTACCDPISGTLVPAEIPPLSTKALELVIGAVHTVLSQILATNSNACQCWREYAMLEEQKMDLIRIFGTGGTSFRTGEQLIEQGTRLLASASRLTASPDTAAKLLEEASKLIEQGTRLAAQGKEEATQTGNLSKTAFDKKLADIDSILKQRWKGDIPARFAKHLDDAVCPHCRKPRQLDETLTLATPEFLHNLLNIAIGGELPLCSVLPFVESVFGQIYNPDMIPDHKKKAMAAFTEKIQLTRMLDTLMNKVLHVFGLTAIIPQSSSGASMPSMNPASTDITPTDGDSPRMTLTADFLPASATGSMTSTAKGSDKTATS